MPIPPDLVVKKLSNRRANVSGGIPGPVSLTSISTCPAKSREVAMVRCPQHIDAGGHGLDRVHHEIHDHLLQLNTVAAYLWQIRCQFESCVYEITCSSCRRKSMAFLRPEGSSRWSDAGHRPGGHQSNPIYDANRPLDLRDRALRQFMASSTSGGERSSQSRAGLGVRLDGGQRLIDPRARSRAASSPSTTPGRHAPSRPAFGPAFPAP